MPKNYQVSEIINLFLDGERLSEYFTLSGHRVGYGNQENPRMTNSINEIPLNSCSSHDKDSVPYVFCKHSIANFADGLTILQDFYNYKYPTKK